jgi:prepilin-type N-terminal cleavage/methylation domain-containing protein
MARQERPARSAGFTLIELMIVVAIIGILAAIAIPKFASLIRKSGEGASKGNLGAVRSALSIYYGDMEGNYPSDIWAMTIGGKYLGTVPVAKAPNYHTDESRESLYTGGCAATITNDWLNFAGTQPAGWSYCPTTTDANFGNLAVNCSHTDTKGSYWETY